jgi:hypothetical protein
MTVLVRASNFEGLLPKAKMIDRDAQNLAATSAWCKRNPNCWSAMAPFRGYPV